MMCIVLYCFFFFKQKTAYEMRISDCSSDVCSSDLPQRWRVDETAMDMQQFLVTDIGCCASDPLEPGVRAQAIETQQKTLSQGCFRQGNPRGRRFESIHQSRVQSSLFQHVQQSGHRPALTDLAFDR